MSRIYSEEAELYDTYLVQQGVFGERAELWRSEWEAERGGTKLHVVWEAIDCGRSRWLLWHELVAP